MKKFIFITILCFIFTNIYSQEQAQEAFKIRMNDHVANYIENEIDMTKAREIYGHTCLEHHIVHDEDVRSRAAEAEKHAFIVNNMAEYKRLFFPQTADRSSTDTLVCDNGGFEDDFLYYKGFSTLFQSGSSTCTPIHTGNPSVYVPATLPTTREFEIVTSGTDAITGIQKVKFGDKALKLNDPYSHTFFTHPQMCNGHHGVNKISKRFKVTEENRDFTVWYAVALENPLSHTNTQPFFSIKCDLAPLSDLCFDSDILDCDDTYNQPICGNSLMHVLDWTCHRIKIPATEIGNIATIEFVMGDCGLSGHNGYAYIDGFCENCTGSALGSIDLNYINYKSCDGYIAEICGSYTLPKLCGSWKVDSIVIPGYPNLILNLDTINKTFCLEFPIELFNFSNCLDLLAEIYFSNLTKQLPVQISNNIEICQRFYDYYSLTVDVGNCQPNSFPVDNNISDDYYYVTVNLTNIGSDSWTIERLLDEPYINENGRYTLTSGSGNQSLILGPFLIQEGSWQLIINLPFCTFVEPIEPPSFCSQCTEFNKLKINNITCGSDPDIWGFDIFVDSASPGYYTINSGPQEDFNTVVTFNNISNTSHCLEYEIKYYNNMDELICTSKFTVCPPKKCILNLDCELEVYVINVVCQKNVDDYYVDVDILGQDNTLLCYKTYDPSNPSSSNNITASLFPTLSQIGPFDEDIYLTVFLCNKSDCSECTNPACFKTIYIPKPDCDDPDFAELRQKKVTSVVETDIKVVPNPINSNEIMLISTLEITKFELLDVSGVSLHQAKFLGSEYRFSTNIPAGIYFIKYQNSENKTKLIKVIKL